MQIKQSIYVRIVNRIMRQVKLTLKYYFYKIQNVKRPDRAFVMTKDPFVELKPVSNLSHRIIIIEKQVL